MSNPYTTLNHTSTEGQPTAAPSAPVQAAYAPSAYVVAPQPAIIVQQPVPQYHRAGVFVSSIEPRSAWNWTLLALYTINIVVSILLYRLPLFYMKWSGESQQSQGFWDHIGSSPNLHPSGSYSDLSKDETWSYSFRWWADDCDSSGKAVAGLVGTSLAFGFGCLISVLLRMHKATNTTIKSIAAERVMLALCKIFMIISWWLFFRNCIYRYVSLSVDIRVGVWPIQWGLFGMLWIGTLILWKIRASFRLY